MLAVLASLALGALSLLAPSAPTTDPWGWIVWGREVAHLQLNTDVGGAPSWKPLPVLLTTPLSLAGEAAPALWLVVARAGALMSLVFAYRLGARLAGAAAGTLAAAGLALSAGWLRSVGHGYTEPLVIGLVLAAVERHVDGDRRRAFALGALAALARPEVWPFLAVYGTLLWRHLPQARSLVAAAAVALPVLWFVPDWVGSGDPLHGSRVAEAVVSRAGAVHALERGALFAPLPLTAGAVFAAGLAALRRDRVTLRLAAWAGAWIAGLFLAMLAGYPASPRFFRLPAALVAVLGAAGLVRLLQTPQSRARRFAVAVALGALVLPFAIARGQQLRVEAAGTAARAHLQGELRAALRSLPPTLNRCGPPTLPSGMGWSRGMVAWELDVPIQRVQEMPHSAPAYVEELDGPHADEAPPMAAKSVLLSPPRPGQRLVLTPFAGAQLKLAGEPRRIEPWLLASAGPWRVVALVPRDASVHAQPCASPRGAHASLR